MSFPKPFSVHVRQEVESLIAQGVIAAVLAEGLAITVNDGDENVLEHSRDADAVLAAMFSTDEDRLYVSSGPESGISHGWILFIYGNDGFDVVSDYTTNLESILAPIVGIDAASLSSRIESGEFRIVPTVKPEYVPLQDRE